MYCDVLCLDGTKLVICHILIVCILGRIQDRNIAEAIQLGKALFDQVAQWKEDALLVQHITYACSLLLLCIISS